MKKQELSALQNLSSSIGYFIRYWGFRNIHGEIWSVVYLAKQPLSGIEICELLGVSKALVSPALKELEGEGLIRQTKSENSKTKRYRAEDDVGKIIHGVLRRREKPMLDTIQKRYSELVAQSSADETLDQDRMQQMGIMIQMAEMGLSSLLSEKLIDG